MIGTPSKESKQLVPNMPYVSTVVDENDPRELGRIRCRVPLLMDAIPDNQLPWAKPRDWSHPEGLRADGNDVQRTGMFGGVPKRGSKVNLYFPTSSPYTCFWSSTVAYDDKSKLPEFGRNYPNRLGFKLSNGTTVIFDTKTNEMYVINPGDMHMTIMGDVNQHIIGNQQLLVTGDKGQIPDYLLNDPHTVLSSLVPMPQNRIKFRGLAGNTRGSQHTEIQGHQTTLVHGNKKEVIKGSYAIETASFSLRAKGSATINGRKVNLGK